MGDEGEGPFYQVGTKDAQLGNWWGRIESPSTDAAQGFYGPFGPRNLANEIRTGWVRPGETVFERPLIEGFYNFGRIGINTELWVAAEDVILISLEEL